MKLTLGLLLATLLSLADALVLSDSHFADVARKGRLRLANSISAAPHTSTNDSVQSSKVLMELSDGRCEYR